jgi:hypothetical protein
MPRSPLLPNRMNQKSDNRIRTFTYMSVLFTLFLVIGCRTPKEPKITETLPPPPINTIRVGDFQCDNAVTAQAIRNVFIEVIGRNRFVKLVRQGEADVILEGTVTYAQAGSSASSLGAGSNWAAGKSRTTVGEYVSGVTSVAYKNGEILTSASWGQVIAKGEELLPPELVARRAAERMVDSLYRHGLKRR